MATDISRWKAEFSGRTFATQEEAEAHEAKVVEALATWLRENTANTGWLNEGQMSQIARFLAGSVKDVRGVIDSVD